MPARLRDAMTLYLASTYRRTPFPRLWAERIAEVAAETGETRIVDLGSGAAGPMPLVVEELRKLGCPAQTVLTDLYPNRRASMAHASITYWREPVDARAVPPSLSGVRTLFASFHHFNPTDAKRILANALESRSPICIFEATSRTPLAIATTILIPLFVWLLTPAIRPLSVFQLVFTYPLPLLPVLIFWDGLVSQLRTYSPAELAEMTSSLNAADYQWTAGTIQPPGLPMAVPYLIGRPSQRLNSSVE
jgi:hypothetical protein